MGAGEGPLSAFVTYDVATRRGHAPRAPARSRCGARRSSTTCAASCGPCAARPTSCRSTSTAGSSGTSATSSRRTAAATPRTASPLPDAAFVFADRLIAFDHRDGTTYVVCLADRAHRAEGRRWVDATCRQLDALPDLVDPAPASRHQQVEFRLSRSYETYIDDIRRIKEHLRDGETYEVCLTNRISADVTADPLELYRLLRRVNPAPFSAYLRLGDAAVLSSSPERFLSVGRDRWVEAKPIKGTTRRGATPAEDAALSEELRDEREEPRREPDDHRPPPQRPRARVRDRDGARPAPDGDRDLRDGPPARLDDPRAPARGPRRAGLRPGVLPRGVDDGSAEEAHHGDHRRARARGARGLLRSDRLSRPRRRART